MKTESKIETQAEWNRQHCLNQEQFKKLLKEKFERARYYHEANKKREILLKNR
jgi:hypothetical protein